MLDSFFFMLEKFVIGMFVRRDLFLVFWSGNNVDMLW